MSLIDKKARTVPPRNAAKATYVRYRVAAFLAAMTFILYLDRLCIGQAATSIQKELGLSETAKGIVFAAFTVSYALFEIPTGHLGDRFGCRKVLTRIVLWWSFFTVLTGAAWGFASLLVIRFLFGVGEAGALPNAARVVHRWFPEASRGRAHSVVTTAMNLGAVVAPYATAKLITAVGWRLSFAVLGVIGVAWAALFYWRFRDDPAEQPQVNEAELAWIRSGRPLAEQQSIYTQEHVPWRRVLTSANVWLAGALMNCAAASMWMITYWYPTYLENARDVKGEYAGQLTSLVMLGATAGTVLGGYIVDLLIRATGSRRWSRCGIGCVSYVVAAIALLFGIRAESPLVTSLALALCCLGVNAQIPAWWGTVTQISGQHVGVLFGLTNMMGAGGAAIAQSATGYMVDWLGDLGFQGRARWDPVFASLSVVMLVGVVLWFFVDPNKSAVDDVELPDAPGDTGQ